MSAGREVLGSWVVPEGEWSEFIADETIAPVDPDTRGNLLTQGRQHEGDVEIVVTPELLRVGRRRFDLTGKQGPVVLGVRDVLGSRKVMEIRLGLRNVPTGAPAVASLRFPYPAGHEHVIVAMRKVHEDRGWGREAYVRPIERHALLIFRVWLAVVVLGALLFFGAMFFRDAAGDRSHVAAAVAVLGAVLSVVVALFMGPHLLVVAPEIRRQGREGAARRRASLQARRR